MLQVCEESGTDLAQYVKKSKSKERNKTSPQFTSASDVEHVRNDPITFVYILLIFALSIFTLSVSPSGNTSRESLQLKKDKLYIV